jgi:N-hydroxyarylamine O-acetyltransferase
MNAEEQSPFLPRYRERIGHQGPLAADYASLSALLAAHVVAIPFENLSVLDGSGVSLDRDLLVQKLIAQRRGGYCFEHNHLFRRVLHALGFEVRALAGRVCVGLPEGSIPPRTHMCLAVQLDGVPYLVDAGFGGLGPRLPMPLHGGSEVCSGHETHRLLESPEGFLLQAHTGTRWLDLYAFSCEPAHDIDFEVANHYTSTHRSSRFKQGLMVMRSTPTGALQLRGRELVRRDGPRTETHCIEDRAELRTVLQRDFSLAVTDAQLASIPGY